MVELFSIQLQSNLPTDQRVMVAHGFRQVKERPGSVEKDRFDHSVQTFNFEGIAGKQPTFHVQRPAGRPILLCKVPRCALSRSGMNVVDDPAASPLRTQSAGEELANSLSHGFGLVGAMIGAPILLLAALHHSNIPFLIGTIIFTTTMLLVYLASTLYHCWPRTHTKFLLQVLDHSAIFLLIAGTYTPFALGPLRGGGGLAMLGIVWALALFGVIMKATRGVLRHRRLAMSLYLGTGWIGLTLIRPLALTIPLSALFWLITGGVAYTAGTLFFANERLRYAHFVWHLFVLAGTSCHFAAVFICAI
jgi:hemolysin III